MHLDSRVKSIPLIPQCKLEQCLTVQYLPHWDHEDRGIFCDRVQGRSIQPHEVLHCNVIGPTATASKCPLGL